MNGPSKYAIDRPTEPVNPGHYRLGKVELIDLIEVLTFNVGNAVKYLVRAGRKVESPVEDLKKAIWYAERELFRVTGKSSEASAEVEKLRGEVATMRRVIDSQNEEISDYEQTTERLREQLRIEEARRASYQAVDAAARRFVQRFREMNPRVGWRAGWRCPAREMAAILEAVDPVESSKDPDVLA